MKDPEDFKFAIKLLHESYVGPGDPEIEFLYHREFGGLDKCRKSWVIETAKMQVDDFNKSLEKVPDNVKVVVRRYPPAFPFPELRAERKTD